MIQQGVGYTVTNSSGGQSLTVDTTAIYKETLPFFIYEDTNEAGTRCFRLNAGTFNNEFPTINGAEIGQPEAYLAEPSVTSLVVLTIPASESAFPDGPCTIALTAGTSTPEASAGEAYLILGKIDVTTAEGGAKEYAVSNLVSGSLWGERFQCGEELEYWFSRI
jgi:hypothetical protein